MLEFLTSPLFLGIILMAGSCAFFLTVYFHDWGETGFKRIGLFVTRLTYSDEDTQSFVRFIWLLAWILGIVASLIISLNDSRIPQNFSWIFINICWDLLLIILMAKLMFIFCVLLRYIWFALIRIKDWVFNGQPLFGKAPQRKISDKP